MYIYMYIYVYTYVYIYGKSPVRAGLYMLILHFLLKWLPQEKIPVINSGPRSPSLPLIP